MDLSSFLTSLITSFVIFVVLVLVFTWLSRRAGNAVVYFPNLVLRGLDPWEGRRRTRSPIAWIREAITASEADVIAAGGVDAAVYLIFLSTVLGILVFSGIVLLPVLLPVAGTDHSLFSSFNASSNSTHFSDLEKLGMGNITKRSARLWAFMLGVYWVSIVAYYILWKAYKHVSDLRAGAKSSEEVKPEEFAILVRDIPAPPAGQTMKDYVDSYFRQLHPDTYYKSIVITDNAGAEKIWNEVEGYKKKLARGEAIFAESKTSSKPEGTRPTMRTGFLGLVGAKVDTIEYCNEKIDELLPKLEEEQKNILREKQQAAAIVIFNSKPAAALASQALHSLKVDAWTVIEAPEPRQLIWTNLHRKLLDRLLRQSIVYFIVFLTVVFYMIPITFISAFTTLQNLKKLLHFLRPVVDQPEVKTVLEAYLPQIVLIIFLALLPTFLKLLSKLEGIPSESHVVRAAAGKYFYFIVFNVFIGVTITGTLFSSLRELIDNPTSIVRMLGNSLPGNATFFLTFVALKFFVGYGLELSRLVPLIIFHLKKKYMCKTEEELKEAWAPGDIGYATRVPNDMLIITIVLCYSVIAPLIVPFGVAYFGLGWLILRNQVLRVYVPSFESNGRMWPHMHSRIIAALIIFQITMIGFMSLKEFVYVPFLIPLLPASAIFAFISHIRFYPAFARTSLDVVTRPLKQLPHMEAVYASYIPPCLKPEKSDEVEFFEDAQSNTSRTISS